MPLPLIPVLIGIVAVTTGAYGTGKTAKALLDNSIAKDVNRNAQDLLDSAKENLENAKETSTRELEALGNQKIQLFQTFQTKFIPLFEQVKNIDFTSSTDLDELAKFKIDKQSFADLKKVTLLATSLAGGTVGGAVAGTAVAFGAYGMAGTFAAASTGTAIASLSGAAATNATLAFFGGGSLAAGGLGMAGGTMVLGGLVAGPALAVLGTVMGSQANANLDKAFSNLETAKKVKEEFAIMVMVCDGIRKRAMLFTRVLIKLDLLLSPMLENFENTIKTEGTDYRSYSNKSKQLIAALLSTVQAVRALLDTPLLEKDGSLTSESGIVVDTVQKQIANL